MKESNDIKSRFLRRGNFHFRFPRPERGADSSRRYTDLKVTLTIIQVCVAVAWRCRGWRERNDIVVRSETIFSLLPTLPRQPSEEQNLRQDKDYHVLICIISPNNNYCCQCRPTKPTPKHPMAEEKIDRGYDHAE
ncbi:hypothetical protein J6590_049953 [Homalodisca vitripennis]|nr:hypothetical protein J6590_049953 [Homalodisca vitripennis]